jgi:hypothetical protein
MAFDLLETIPIPQNQEETTLFSVSEGRKKIEYMSSCRKANSFIDILALEDGLLHIKSKAFFRISFDIMT